MPPTIANLERATLARWACKPLSSGVGLANPLVFGAGATLRRRLGRPWSGKADNRPQLSIDLDQGARRIDVRRIAGCTQQGEEPVDSLPPRLDLQRVLPTRALLRDWIQLNSFEEEHT